MFKAWRSRRFGVISVSFAGAALLAGALAAPSQAAQDSTSGGAAAATRTTLTRVGSSTPAASTGARSGAVRVAPLLRPHRSGAATSRSSAPVTGSTATVPSASAAGARVLQNFAGVDAIQNKKATGFDLEPPDEGLGAGNGYVVNFVNVTGAVYSSGGRMFGHPFFLNTFFKEPTTAFTSDPRVFYDASSHSWFATILEAGFTKAGTIGESHVDIAVSSSANPRNAWNIYRIPTSNPNHAGCPCLADYPIMGIDAHNVYVSTNEFTSNLQGFNGTQLYAVAKSQLVAGASHVNVVFFPDLAVAGAPAYHVQPANTYGSAPAEYLMGSLDPFSTFDQRLAVFAVTNGQSVANGRGMPTLSSTVIRSEAYSFPPNAQTPPGFCPSSACGSGGAPTSGVVSTDFDAMQEVQYINGQLVGALNTGVTISGDTGPRSGVAWFVVRPTLSGAHIGSGTHVTRQGYVAQRGEYLLYPHVNMSANGSMAMVFGLGGPATYLSAAFAVAAPGQGFGGIRLAAAGTGPDNGFTGTAKFGGVGRWGDYSNGQIIPGTNRVWLATQYIPNSGDGIANWGNRIVEVQTGGVS